MTTNSITKILTLSTFAAFWISFGFSVFSIGKGNWVNSKTTNETFGAFKQCEDKNCINISGHTPLITVTKAFSILSLIIGFFGWCSLLNAQMTNWFKAAAATSVLYAFSGVFYIIAMSCFRAEFCKVSCEEYIWNYEFITGWISGGAVLVGSILALVLTIRLKRERNC